MDQSRKESLERKLYAIQQLKGELHVGTREAWEYLDACDRIMSSPKVVSAEVNLRAGLKKGDYLATPERAFAVAYFMDRMRRVFEEGGHGIFGLEDKIPLKENQRAKDYLQFLFMKPDLTTTLFDTADMPMFSGHGIEPDPLMQSYRKITDFLEAFFGITSDPLVGNTFYESLGITTERGPVEWCASTTPDQSQDERKNLIGLLSELFSSAKSAGVSTDADMGILTGFEVLESIVERATDDRLAGYANQVGDLLIPHIANFNFERLCSLQALNAGVSGQIRLARSHFLSVESIARRIMDDRLERRFEYQRKLISEFISSAQTDNYDDLHRDIDYDIKRIKREIGYSRKKVESVESGGWPDIAIEVEKRSLRKKERILEAYKLIKMLLIDDERYVRKLLKN